MVDKPNDSNDSSLLGSANDQIARARNVRGWRTHSVWPEQNNVSWLKEIVTLFSKAGQGVIDLYGL